jgi:regulator of protease activity HflC (stomatin/prohibitin superfamily)/membrane protein implicated in regulation of membrane protease activity
MISTDGVVFFQVLDAAKAAYEVSDLYVAIMQLTTTNLRTVMGSMDLDETLSKRDEINARLLAVVDQATESWGVKITRVEIKDIRPPADIVNAMGRQMKAEREKRALILESEGLRASEILKAEGAKQSQILQAEGRREAAFRDAEAREREAEAEARATSAVSEAIAGGNAQAINYFIAQKYVEAVGEFARSPNAKTILFPVEATNLIGTLGGIGEIAKEAFGQNQTATGAQPAPATAAWPVQSGRRMIAGLPPHFLWLLAAILLAGAELLVPGSFLIWLAAAAALTGVVYLLTGMPIELQFVTFAALSVGSVLAGRRLYAVRDPGSGDPQLNDRTARLVGRRWRWSPPSNMAAGACASVTACGRRAARTRRRARGCG